MRHRDTPVGGFLLAEKEGGFTGGDGAVLALFAQQAVAAIAHARAQSDERRAKADLEALVETSPVGVVVFDAATGALLSFEESKAGGTLTEDDAAEILARVRRRYEQTLSPYHAAANLWVDALIDPRRTWQTLDLLLAVACRHDPEEGFKLGVFQV